MERPFDGLIGRLDRVLSEMMMERDRVGSLDEADRQTLKHHAEDMMGAGASILGKLKEGFERPKGWRPLEVPLVRGIFKTLGASWEAYALDDEEAGLAFTLPVPGHGVGLNPQLRENTKWDGLGTPCKTLFFVHLRVHDSAGGVAPQVFPFRFGHGEVLEGRALRQWQRECLEAAMGHELMEALGA